MGTTGKRGSINLTALGSAAVIAVYAAGYMRTRAAASRFEGSDSERRRVPPAGPAVVRDTVVATPPSADATAPAIVVEIPTPKAKAKSAAARPADTVKPAPTPVEHDSTPVDSVVVPVATPIPAADTAKSVADSVKLLKDGKYTGWGTSRHGDIEAAVEIANGRIVSAYITQCLTRYSCERIATIIPQVVQRQSAEVDYVSGATQSSDAFYYAVLEALKKAK